MGAEPAPWAIAAIQKNKKNGNRKIAVFYLVGSHGSADRAGEEKGAGLFLEGAHRFAGSFFGSVVARMNTTCAGGSSNVFKSALNAAGESM